MIGQVLNGNYRLTDLVGAGGYADVYLARDLRTNTIVAVKILHSHVARDPDVAARFEREASLARRLQTPHVARILDAGQDPTSPPFMVMEFVQGLTVSELIRRRGPFPIHDAVDIVDQVLSALGAAHALGIVHRDIKPQNLMVDAGRRLKVLDFGVARVVGAGTMTATGHLLGTPEYMAAEQVEGRPTDHRTDLYGVGAVLYQLLTGRPPYLRDANTDLWELISRVRTELPPPVRQLRPAVPASIALIVERAMAKDPAQRFQSAYEMRQALAAAAGGDPPTPQPLPAAPGRPPETMILPGTGSGATPPPPPPGQAPTRPYGSPPIPAPPRGAAPGPQPGPYQGPGQPGAPGTGPYPPGQYHPGPYSQGPYQQGQGPYQQGQGAPPFGQAPMPPRRNGERSGLAGWQIVGLVVGAVVLVIVGAMLGRFLPLPGGSPTPTPTRATAAATATAVLAASPAAASSSVGKPASPAASPSASTGVGVARSGPPPSPSQSPVAAAKPTTSPAPAAKPTASPNPPGVLLADNFESAETGQLPRVSARPSDYVFSYDGGEYVINKVNAALPAAPIVFVPGSYENSVVAVDVRIMGDVSSRYAFVVCRDQSTGGQAKQYRASIVPEGQRVILSRWDDGTQRVLAEARDEPAIRTGNATNRLELRCAAAKIVAVVNGKTVASADDMTLSKGDHGIGAGTFSGVEGTLEARFDNLEVRVP
jgi:serine/threonine protein kinase